MNDIRKKIDALDNQIVKLLNERAKKAIAIGKAKLSQKDSIYVPAREREVLEHIWGVNKGPLDKTALAAIYREIMSASLALEKQPMVAYLGPEGTFTHQAARSRFGSSVKYMPRETISDVFESVQKAKADYGVVPVENSTEGAVTHTLDEFFETPLKICSEIYLKISQNLLSNCPVAKIKRVYSHPNVFGQCRKWLNRELPGVELVPTTSTARAVQIAGGEKDAGAIAGMPATEAGRMRIRAADIQDFTGNTTRFLVIGGNISKATGKDKTSIVFSVKHQAGTLYMALGSLNKFGLNMTKIESRPSRIREWEYLFFVDIEGHVESPKVKKAMADLEQHCLHLKVLGSYPRAPGVA